ncbi:hypothetical protein FJZ21_01045 [Candidatus Pacearchaeota archaeon]|nr:hypothetical protein [Candidatus Pacearchaeota archaeon]
MVNLVFIAIVILAVFLFFKITSFRYERWWTYLIAILLIFVLFSFFNVTKANDINLNSFEGFVSGTKAYFVWLTNFGKATASITGKATLGWNVTNISA